MMKDHSAVSQEYSKGCKDLRSFCSLAILFLNAELLMRIWISCQESNVASAAAKSEYMIYSVLSHDRHDFKRSVVKGLRQ